MNRSAILTFDYEVFMGRETGTIENCVIRPTTEILNILKKNRAKAIFFVDAPWLLFLKENFIDDFNRVSAQLRDIVVSGSYVELHIHPQWINAEICDNKIFFASFRHYRLHSLESEEIISIFKRSSEVLESITGRRVKCFRAGGWCIEPFDKIRAAFEAEGIKYDFSVVPEIRIDEGKDYDFDFTSAPPFQFYRFSNDVQIIENSGPFVEFPLSTYRSNALFRIFNKVLLVMNHDTMFGDGRGLKEKTARNTLESLFSISGNMLTLDKTHNLVFRAILRFFFRKRELLVIVSHPKTVSGQALINLKYITGNYSTIGVDDIEVMLS